ncbi:hypothetical protein J8C06_04345 [Chloracidobacterium validum]|uniref:Uncharacterized protein n=1 Tax=Chloracidobacterium validum TaxID=2821543 RepID=A0ABX8BDF1_9BACT|nr:hypothetical protein [Chloracidobacterium validum]QUW03673.1 hypothetical protein J8C06_04345 [Chloracidobacterium validum]
MNDVQSITTTVVEDTASSVIAPPPPLAPETSLAGAGQRWLFELDMLVQSLGHFFRVELHPLPESSCPALRQRDFTEELRIIRQTVLRMNYLSTEVITFLQASIAKGDTGRLTKSATPDMPGVAGSPLVAALYQLTEALFDVRTIIDDLIRAKPVGCHTFTAIGRLLNQSIEQSGFQPAVRQMIVTPKPEIRSDALHKLVAALPDPALRQDLRYIFSCFYRLLRYLDFIQDDLRQDRPLKSTLPIFILVRAEAEALIEFIETRPMRLPNLLPDVTDAFDATVYALEMELQKIYGRELVGFAELHQAPPIYARTENAHGLLRDCFQQSLVALAVVFDPAFDGAAAFDMFQTKLEQSLHLRDDIWRLLCHLRRFESRPDKTAVAPLIERITLFRDTSLRFLMYKDWDEYDRFLDEVQSARNLEELLKTIHLLSTFLETLLGQINMRAVLANHPFDYPSLDDA